LIPIKNSGE